MSESLESLLEFLAISGRCAVVQLEPPRSAQFADALRLAMEFRDAAIRKAVAEEREACAKLCDAEQARWHDTEATDVLDGDRWQHRQQANTARDLAVTIRARGAR